MKAELPKELHSERLLLRLPRKSDFVLMRKYIEHPSMRKYSFYRHDDLDIYPRVHLGPARKLWKAETGYRFSIVLKDINKMIGHVMLKDVNKTNRNAEIGYWMARDYWGKGYTKEAVQMLMEFGFQKLKLKRLYALVIGGNEISVGLLKKLGFQLEVTTRKHELIRKRYHDVHSFGLLVDEYIG